MIIRLISGITLLDRCNLSVQLLEESNKFKKYVPIDIIVLLTGLYKWVRNFIRSSIAKAVFEMH